MVYNNNVPQAQQTIAFTQPIINTNFATIALEQKVNHTFTDTSGSNAIAGEADGSHQKLNFPNQLADITGALPTGIADIAYAKGGSLFAWDGTTKQPVSGVTKQGSVALVTSVPVTIATLPTQCIGMVVLTNSSGSFTMCYPFMTFLDGTATPRLAVVVQAIYSSPPYSATRAGALSLDLQIALLPPTANQTLFYKLIYWPV